MSQDSSPSFGELPPSRPARLILIRHAESMRNEAKKGAVYFADEYARSKVKGIPDHEIALTPHGLEHQAKPTGIGLLKEYGIPDYIYHSGYRRTEETVEGILDCYTPEQRALVKVRHNVFIRERDPGYTYEMTEKEAEQLFPFLKEYWKIFGGFMARPVGGESLADVVTRVYTFLNTIFRDRAGQNVFVVTHGGTIRCFRFLLERWTYQQALKWPIGQSPKNCGVTVYEFDPEVQRLVLRAYNKVYYEHAEDET